MDVWGYFSPQHSREAPKAHSNFRCWCSSLQATEQAGKVISEEQKLPFFTFSLGSTGNVVGSVPLRETFSMWTVGNSTVLKTVLRSTVLRGSKAKSIFGVALHFNSSKHRGTPNFFIPDPMASCADVLRIYLSQDWNHKLNFSLPWKQKQSRHTQYQHGPTLTCRITLSG